MMTTRITQVAKRLFGVPDFHYFALADGLAALLSQLGRCRPCSTSPPPPVACQLALSFADA
jgi:hypothetical protein